MSRVYYLDPRMSISHSAEGTSWSNTKYISREWKNGKWVYTYPKAKKANAVDKVKNTAKKIGNAASNITKQIGQTANDIGSKVSKGVSDTSKKAKDAISKTFKKIHDEKRKKYWEKERKTPEYQAKMKAIKDGQESRRYGMEHKYWTEKWSPYWNRKEYWEKERKTPEYQEKMKTISENNEKRRLSMLQRQVNREMYPIWTGMTYEEAKGYSKGHYPEGAKKEDNKPKSDNGRLPIRVDPTSKRLYYGKQTNTQPKEKKTGSVNKHRKK